VRLIDWQNRAGLLQLRRMPEKSINQVSRNWRELYEKGHAALQRKNYDYAIAIFNQILQAEPGLYECREALRDTQFKKNGESSGFFKKMIGTASNSPQMAKAQFSVRSNPQEALSACEEVLNKDPSNVGAHKLLAEAAVNLDFPKTAVLSLGIAFKNSPRDQDLAVRLAEALVQTGQIDQAEKIYTELLRANPGDPNLSQALKNLSASRTLKEGGYDALSGGGGSYRDILKDKHAAVSIEQENRQVKSDDVAGRLLGEYEARLEKEPGNVRLMRSIAELYNQKKQFDRALEYYERIRASDGGNDPSLDRDVATTIGRKFDYQISQLDQTTPEYPQVLEKLESEKQEFLINDAKRRVEKYANDLQFRYELGVLYFKANRITEAMQEFQKAQHNPNRRVQALYHLGLCFAKRNLNDLAAKTLQNAIKDKEAFDNEKKELIYALATVLEKMGKANEAIENFKLIYEVDIGFKDVAQKVEAFYSTQ
jgi:tetratricopeptide (TPR) repeat protein